MNSSRFIALRVGVRPALVPRLVRLWMETQSSPLINRGQIAVHTSHVRIILRSGAELAVAVVGTSGDRGAAGVIPDSAVADLDRAIRNALVHGLVSTDIPRVSSHPVQACVVEPPRFLERLLLLLLPYKKQEAIAGDLQEKFKEIRSKHGVTFARWWYAGQAMGILLFYWAPRIGALVGITKLGTFLRGLIGA